MGESIRGLHGIDVKALWQNNKAAKAENLSVDGYCVIPSGVLAMRTLSSHAKVVYTGLLSFIRSKGTGRVNPSYEAMIERTGLSRGQVGRAIDDLSRAHLVRVFRTGRSFAFEIRSLVEREREILSKEQEKERVVKKFSEVKRTQDVETSAS